MYSINGLTLKEINIIIEGLKDSIGVYTAIMNFNYTTEEERENNKRKKDDMERLLNKLTAEGEEK